MTQRISRRQEGWVRTPATCFEVPDTRTSQPFCVPRGGRDSRLKAITSGKIKVCGLRAGMGSWAEPV
jgi:hypothetical protein